MNWRFLWTLYDFEFDWTDLSLSSTLLVTNKCNFVGLDYFLGWSLVKDQVLKGKDLNGNPTKLH